MIDSTLFSISFRHSEEGVIARCVPMTKTDGMGAIKLALGQQAPSADQALHISRRSHKLLALKQCLEDWSNKHTATMNCRLKHI